MLTDNTFNMSRKSAAPIIGLRKTSATPSSQKQMAMNFNVGANTTQSRQTTALQKHQLQRPKTSFKSETTPYNNL
jgi:hypothetical protein